MKYDEGQRVEVSPGPLASWQTGVCRASGPCKLSVAADQRQRRSCFATKPLCAPCCRRRLLPPPRQPPAQARQPAAQPSSCLALALLDSPLDRCRATLRTPALRAPGGRLWWCGSSGAVAALGRSLSATTRCAWPDLALC